MTSNAPRPERARIVVFAKAPVAGVVKTRLVPLLGPDGAAGLHAGLVRHALSTALRAGSAGVELWCAPDASHDFFARCAREFGVALRNQEGPDLGARMRHAAGDVLARGEAAVIIGADCPALTAAHLREAADAVRTQDVAIAPAEDGGYVLLALSRDIAAIFEGVAWGSASVMGETRQRLRASKAAFRELATLWDVDRPEDYARLQREGLLAEVMS